jgi:asparagine synthase (glutamine-hydrolysing)
MCGILGWFGSSDRANPAGFSQALDLLRHRGPDDQGTQTLSLPSGASVILGHRRLSILDLSPLGHQPMTSPRTGAVIVFNGEIYNFQDLQNELKAKGYTFQSTCDTEVLLAAYDEWGEAAVTRLNGIFAFAIWDPRTQTFLLARDHVGIKPLYAYDDGETFAFGSELTALVAATGKTPALRPEAVAEFFAFGYLVDTLTPLKHFFKLPPGHLLTYQATSRTLRMRRYWNPMDFFTAPEFTEDENVLADRLEELLTDAIRRQLVSDVPLGAFLSGGVDSTLVVALMTKVAAAKPKTYSIGFTLPEWDEAPWAKRIAAHLGTEHFEQYISPQGLSDTILDVAGLYDEPFGDTSAIPTTLLCRMTRQHVTVALSGDGGDELFFGYDRYRQSVRYQSFHRLPRPVRWAGLKLLEGLPVRRFRHWARALGQPTLAACYSLQSQWSGWPRLFPSAGNFRWDSVAQDVSSTLGPDRWEKIMPGTDVLTYLPEDILAKVDRASMSVALEARVPILDYRLVEFAARVPPHMKYRNGVSKYLMRKVLERHVPRHLWERPKSGFSIPLADWFRKELRTWVQDELTLNWDWTLGVINRPAAESMIADHLSGKANYAVFLWGFLSWRTWLRRVGLLK